MGVKQSTFGKQKYPGYQSKLASPATRELYKIIIMGFNYKERVKLSYIV